MIFLTKEIQRQLYLGGPVIKEKITDGETSLYLDNELPKLNDAYYIYERCMRNTLSVAQSLSIGKQLKSGNCIFEDLQHYFQELEILFVREVGSNLIIEMVENTFLILTRAEVLEEETDPEHVEVVQFELHKSAENFELHLLVKKDEELYYLTYRFKDMKLKLWHIKE